MISIEVTYALSNRQIILSIEVPHGTTLIQAIQISTILEQFPEIDLQRNQVGVFGKTAKLDTILRDKDRVEIYRPLLIDPKEIRRQKVAQKKRLKRK